MRVLVANKFWYDRGGLEHVMLEEVRELTALGHDVAHFSTAHPRNDDSPWSSYFAPYSELADNRGLSPTERGVAAARMFYNLPAARRFRRLLHAFRPDVVHIHGIHRQISPSILVEARRASVPVVQTMHDYHAICAAGTLLQPPSSVCDPVECTSLNHLPCMRHRCVKSSVAESMLGSLELYSRAAVLRCAHLVDAIVAPSSYLASKLRLHLPACPPVSVVRNAAPQVPDQPPLGDFFLFAGRLSPEKGVSVLVHAARLVGEQVVIAGEGPLARELARDLPANVTLVGRVSHSEVMRLVSACRAMVAPSVCAENAPLAVLEAMAAGRPVIATRVGGLPELVSDDREGLLIEPNDSARLAAAMHDLSRDSARAERLGAAARRRAQRDFSSKVHMEGLVAVYERALPA